jgi:serine/threonine protein kinase
MSYHPVVDQYTKFFSFNDFRGFKKIKSIEKDYVLENVLGKGTFGEVKKATNIKGQFICAVKIIDKNKLKSNEVYFELMQSELEVL